jgi:hypothetical protein
MAVLIGIALFVIYAEDDVRGFTDRARFLPDFHS